jgi:hypothetical protein
MTLTGLGLGPQVEIGAAKVAPVVRIEPPSFSSRRQ